MRRIIDRKLGISWKHVLGILLFAGAILLFGVVPAQAVNIQSVDSGAAEPDHTTSSVNTAPYTEGLPQKLFDIRFIIDRMNMMLASDLVARTTFQSFGRVPTRVSLSFTVMDPAGNVQYSKDEDTIIQTEGIVVTRFTDLSLPPGDYTIALQTRYNIDVVDNFRASFTIREASAKTGVFVLVGVIIFVTLFSIGAFIYSVFGRRRTVEPDAFRA